MNIAEAVKQISQQLATLSQTPRLDAELLICQAIKQSRAHLLAYSEQIFTPEEYEQLQHLTQRRLQGEPMAYIAGYKDFWTLEFKVSPAVLIPRPETEHIIEWILLNYSENSPVKMVDLGTGSGAIALSLAAERQNWHIDAVEQSLEALTIAKENALIHQLPQVNFYRGSWLSALPLEKYDLIVSNPPYIALDDKHLKELRHEPLEALVSGSDGLEAIREIIAQAPEYLINSGYLILEHGFEQADKIIALLQQKGFIEIKNHRDLADLPRFTTARWKES